MGSFTPLKAHPNPLPTVKAPFSEHAGKPGTFRFRVFRIPVYP